MTQLPFDWVGTPDRLDMNGADRELVRAMELRTYNCGHRRVGSFHDPHTRDDDGQLCPGLRTRLCGLDTLHDHHRWAEPDAFYWCQPFDYLRQVESVDSASRPS